MLRAARKDLECRRSLVLAPKESCDGDDWSEERTKNEADLGRTQRPVLEVDLALQIRLTC